MLHLSQALHETAASLPNKEAIVFGDERITWSELDRKVTNLADAFLQMGVQPGDRIGVFSYTRPEYIYTYLAAARIGAILTGFNINYTIREFVEQAELVQPSIMVLTGEISISAQLRPLVEAMPYVNHCLSIGENHDGWPDVQHLVEQQRKETSTALSERARLLDENHGALIVYTGGVDGVMKGAVLSHKNIVTTIRAQNKHMDWRSDDKIISHLPMNHVSGATLVTVGALLSGATSIMLDRFHPERSLELVEQERISIMGQVPTMWAMQLLLPHFDSYDLSSVRLSIVSGGPTHPDILRRIATIGRTTVHAYGLTEASGMIAYNRLDDDLNTLLRSAGKCPPEFEITILNGGTKSAEPGTPGEIAIRGDCVMSGYFRQPEATAAVIDDEGWMRTGDLGVLDENGYLAIIGRNKEMYICGGYNVYPAEIESYLRRHPAVEQCACLSLPDPIMGEVGILFVFPRAGVELTNKELRQYCKQGLAKYKIPRYIEISNELPVSVDRRIDKERLKVLVKEKANNT